MKTKTLNTDLSLLLLRMGGFLMFFHGLHKLINGHDFIKQTLSDKGLPEFLWIGVPVSEVVAPVLLLLGICTRLSGLTLAVVMLFSVYLTHSDHVSGLSPQHGGLIIELNLLYFFVGSALFFSGGGKYVVYKSKNEWLR